MSTSARAFAALCAGLAACALWLPLRDEVVFSTADLYTFLIPELQLHLNGDHVSGPALWDPHVQLGRPAEHTGGLSQAYWLCRVLSWAMHDVWNAYTALVLATFVLGGLFAWGLFRTLGLHPWAAAASALGFAFAPFHGHAGMFLCYASGSVWAMGLCWALALHLRRASFASGLLLAFVVHSSVLSAYPQQLVWNAWLALGLVLALLPERGQRLRRLSSVALWGLVGLLSAAPFLLDLWEQARGSSRWFDETVLRDPELPGTYAIEGARAWLAGLRELGDPLWNGREFFIESPYLFWGGSFTPFFGAALLFAVATVRTRLVRIVSVLVVAEFLFSVVSALYLFGIHYLGLWLSLLVPFSAATPAIFLLAAVGLDRCLRVRGGWSRSLFALPLLALLGAGALADGRALDGWNVGVSLALAAGAACALVRPSWALLAAAALVSAAHYGVAGLPVESRALVEKRQQWQGRVAAEVARLAPGQRFAWVNSVRPQQLPPNAEQLFGLYSIHSYDPLASRRYQEWTKGISERGSRARGRFFEHIVGLDGLASVEFARAGVRVVLSHEELQTSALRAVGKVGVVYLYEVVDPHPLEAWIPRSAVQTTAGEARMPAEIARVERPLVRRTSIDVEHIVLDVDGADEPGLLWLSQQFHPRWEARAGDERLDTVLVDGFWQGVLVPAGTAEVRLDFRPWMCWWWAPQLLFALGGLVVCLQRSVAAVPRRTAATSPLSRSPSRGDNAAVVREPQDPEAALPRGGGETELLPTRFQPPADLQEGTSGDEER